MFLMYGNFLSLLECRVSTTKQAYNLKQVGWVNYITLFTM